MFHRLLLLLAAGALAAQEPVFETASIHPTPPDAQCGMIEDLPGGSLRVDCLTLSTIVMWAYSVQKYQVTGGPPWASTARWNILAKPAAGETLDGPAEYEKMTHDQQARFMSLVRQRTRALLADRFSLQLRHETREQTAYVMSVAKGGPKLKEAPDGSISRRPGRITGNGASMQALAEFLAIDLGRPVTDETALSGRYAFTLEWAASPERDTGPSVFTAMEEQLGLRLDARKAPVETLVIERAEKPDDR